MCDYLITGYTVQDKSNIKIIYKKKLKRPRVTQNIEEYRTKIEERDIKKNME